MLSPSSRANNGYKHAYSVQDDRFKWSVSRQCGFRPEEKNRNHHRKRLDSAVLPFFVDFLGAFHRLTTLLEKRALVSIETNRRPLWGKQTFFLLTYVYF